MVIFDALNLAQGLLAVLHLPMKLRIGIHGNFVDRRDIEEWRRKRDAKAGLVSDCCGAAGLAENICPERGNERFSLWLIVIQSAPSIITVRHGPDVSQAIVLSIKFVSRDGFGASTYYTALPNVQLFPC